MRRLHIVCIALLGVLIVVGCSDDGAVRANDVFGGCKIRAKSSCPDQDLRGVSLVSANMRGMDLTRANLGGADLREVDLAGARLVNADLSNADLTAADLRGADLTNSALNFTNFSRAEMAGAILTGATICNTTLSDGRTDPGICTVKPVATPGAPTGPPVIVSFGPAPPAKCISDGAGDGIEVAWVARNVTGITFLVDNIRVEGATKPRSSLRIPFACDDKPHRVTMQAYGLPPLATASFTLSVGPGTAPKPSG